MKIEIEKYKDVIQRLPNYGQHIVGYFDDETIVVYQAFRDSIADYAIQNQRFGGKDYSFNRMSWIKPNFLWMMYRSGWATKEGQQRILAITITKESFEEILAQAVFSSFKEDIYPDHDSWKQAVSTSDVRLQWDPDHDPYGNKIERRAIQLGLRGNALLKFVEQDTILIEEVTDFVNEQYSKVQSADLDSLLIPKENVFVPSSESLALRLGISLKLS